MYESTALVDLATPLNAATSLTTLLVGAYIPLPGVMGGAQWLNLAHAGATTHAVLTNMAAPGASGLSGWGFNSNAPGALGEVRFDGTDDLCDCGRIGINGWAYGCSVAILCKPVTGIGVNAGVFHEWDGATGPILFLSGTGTNLIWQCGTSGARLTVNSVITVDAWNHIMVTGLFSSTATDVFYAYVNGRQVGALTTGGVNTAHTSTAKIGSNAGGLSTFMGPMASVLVWKRVLGPGEVEAVYRESRRGYPTLLRRVTQQAQHGGTAARLGGRFFPFFG